MTQQTYLMNFEVENLESGQRVDSPKFVNGQLVDTT